MSALEILAPQVFHIRHDLSRPIRACANLFDCQTIFHYAYFT